MKILTFNLAFTLTLIWRRGGWLALSLCTLPAQAYPGYAGPNAIPQAIPGAGAGLSPAASTERAFFPRPMRRAPDSAPLAWPTALMATVGHALVLPLPGPVLRVLVGDPAVADYRVTSRSELYVLGKTVGTTNLVLWPVQGAPVSLSVTVGMDLVPLAQALTSNLPNEHEISLRLAAGSVVLSGRVSTAQAAEAAQRLAQAFMAPATSSVASGTPNNTPNNTPLASAAVSQDITRVINLLEVRDAQQVLLDVRIAEVSKSLLDKLGLGVQASGGGDGTRWRILSSFLGGGGGALDLLFRNGNALSLEAEKKDGLVKVLAEPTLVAMSGQEGSFLVGGKVFIPVAQTSSGSGSNITLQEREFGVGLKFVPTVVDAGRVNLKVATEVSEISKEAVSTRTVGAALLPAFTTRRVATSVQLLDGQSLVIGGLIRNNSTATVSAFPVLGELPVLGALFRSTQFTSDQTELVVVVRASLVKPGARDAPPAATSP